MEEILPPLKDEDLMIAGMCYPLWFVIPFMVLFSGKKNEPYLKFNALQSLFLGLVSSVGYLLLLFVVFFVIRFIPAANPILGTFILLCIIALTIVFLALIILLFYYASRALKGEFFEVPYLGSWLERFFPEYQEKTDSWPPDATDQEESIYAKFFKK